MVEALMDESKQMGLTINEGKTKNMILSRKNNRHNNLIVKDMEFEFAENFKYLRVELIMLGNNHKEIKVLIPIKVLSLVGLPLKWLMRSTRPNNTNLNMFNCKWITGW